MTEPWPLLSDGWQRMMRQMMLANSPAMPTDVKSKPWTTNSNSTATWVQYHKTFFAVLYSMGIFGSLN